MSSENVNRHRVSKILVGDLQFEVLTLGNGSQINIERLANGILPKTFWIDLQHEFESMLAVAIVGMELRPSDLRRPEFRDTIHIIHKPNFSETEFAKLLAHEEIAELNRMKQTQSLPVC